MSVSVCERFCLFLSISLSPCISQATSCCCFCCPAPSVSLPPSHDIAACGCLCVSGDLSLEGSFGVPVHVCVSISCVHICVCVCPCMWVSWQSSHVPMRNLFQCVCVCVCLHVCCVHIHVCVQFSACVSPYLLWSCPCLSLCVPVSCGSVCVPECLCPGLPVSMSMLVHNCVSVCQSLSLWQRWTLLYVWVCLYPPALPMSPSLSRLVLVCLFLPVFAVYVYLCQGSASPHELRVVYIFKWLKKKSKE